jgi:5-methylcytosine-specific restriction protein A
MIGKLIRKFLDEKAKTQGKKRSAHWSSVRNAHIDKQPNCQVCGGSKDLQVHHVQPFHEHPELELDPNNLITLCESGTNCHLNYGHAGNFRGYNPEVVADAVVWSGKFLRSRKLSKNPTQA